MGRGLALSAAVHAIAFACLLWLRRAPDRDPAPPRESTTFAVDVVEAPAMDRPAQPAPQPAAEAPAAGTVAATRAMPGRADGALPGGVADGVADGVASLGAMGGSAGTVAAGGAAGDEGLGRDQRSDGVSRGGVGIPSAAAVAAKLDAGWAPYLPGVRGHVEVGLDKVAPEKEITPPLFGPCIVCMRKELVAWAKDPTAYYVEQGEAPPFTEPPMKTPLGPTVQRGLSLADVGVDPTFDPGWVAVLPVVTARFGGTGSPRRGLRIEAAPDPGRAMSALPQRLDDLAGDPRLAAVERRRLLFELWDECREEGLGLEARRIIEEAARRHFPAGTEEAYPAAELEALNARRTSSAGFAPYGD